MPSSKMKVLNENLKKIKTNSKDFFHSIEYKNICDNFKKYYQKQRKYENDNKITYDQFTYEQLYDLFSTVISNLDQKIGDIEGLSDEEKIDNLKNKIDEELVEKAKKCNSFKNFFKYNIETPVPKLPFLINNPVNSIKDEPTFIIPSIKSSPIFKSSRASGRKKVANKKKPTSKKKIIKKKITIKNKKK